MDNNVIQVSGVDSLAALNRSEIDVQIATAKQYPRDVRLSLENIRALTMRDVDTAAGCFYFLSRKNGRGEESVIEGPSVRAAEIIATCWGNLRVQARIIGNDGKQITAQGICHDLETNVAASVEVKRRITDKYGKTYSEDMQVVTGNAACAIAMRNAVFKVVPAVLVKDILDEAKALARPSKEDLAATTKKMLAAFASIGVDESQVLQTLGVTNAKQINQDMVLQLRGLWTAISEGSTTKEEAFAPKLDAIMQQAVADKFKNF